MASPLEDLTRLLAGLATHLSRPPAGGGGSVDTLSVPISSLAAALDPSSAVSGGGGGGGGTRVLDTALSLMCFDPLQVDRARVGCLVRTIVSALSASVSCRVARPSGCGAAELLCVGSSVSPGDCRELVRSCAALLGKLGDCDAAGHSYDLLYAVVKVALLAPRYQCLLPLPYYKEDEENISFTSSISTDLTWNPSYHMLPSHHSIPLRVLLWHLDPSILKHDLPVMLQEAIRRPLICLRKELHDRMEWRVILVCLVCSPPIFMEMRSLLHIWFLMTGHSSVLELHTAVVSSALDALFEPMAWGISMELAQKFPFSHAYFPSQHSDLLAILTGPISCRSFLDLVSYIETMVYSGETRTVHSLWKGVQSPTAKGPVDFRYNSAWSMLINFPIWFSFASAILFHREGSQGYLSETLSKEMINESVSDTSFAQRAALYLSWVLCPSNEKQCQMLANNILELSHSWARNNQCYAHHASTVNHRKKLRMPTVGNTEKLHVSTNPVNSLIKEFDDRCMKLWSITAVSQAQHEKLPYLPPHNFLHLQIPLGVLLVSSSCINEQSCDELLHYTSTGLVLESNEVKRKTKDYVGNDGLSACHGGFTEKCAISGVHLIFSWLDIIEHMSAVIFESEDTSYHFVSELRNKTGPYLLKCVNSLFEEPNEAAQDKDFVIDLCDRLVDWINRGHSFDGREAFTDVILEMNKRIMLS